MCFPSGDMTGVPAPLRDKTYSKVGTFLFSWQNIMKPGKMIIRRETLIFFMSSRIHLMDI
jgi:hypothetical protein